ncbi:hypothetical protein ACFLTY_03240 [Chloroflexota bacterium]
MSRKQWARNITPSCTSVVIDIIGPILYPFNVGKKENWDQGIGLMLKA